jgi:hypothetical protein
MLELSMHILDIAENSTRASANLIQIRITEDMSEDRLTIEIEDDGTGMEPEVLNKVLDPFYTSKTVRRIGLGLPMFSHAAKKAEGSFSIQSKKGSGTRVTALFKRSHIDRQPLGDMAETMITLIAGCPDSDFVYTHQNNGSTYEMDTREIKAELEDVPINNTNILHYIKENIESGLKEIGAGY